MRSRRRAARHLHQGQPALSRSQAQELRARVRHELAPARQQHREGIDVRERRILPVAVDVAVDRRAAGVGHLPAREVGQIEHERLMSAKSTAPSQFRSPATPGAGGPKSRPFATCSKSANTKSHKRDAVVVVRIRLHYVVEIARACAKRRQDHPVVVHVDVRVRVEVAAVIARIRNAVVVQVGLAVGANAVAAPLHANVALVRPRVVVAVRLVP